MAEDGFSQTESEMSRYSVGRYIAKQIIREEERRATGRRLQREAATRPESTTFTVDARILSFDGPYYGLPLVGIALGAVVVAVAVALLLRRRRGGAAVTTAPEEKDVPEAA